MFKMIKTQNRALTRFVPGGMLSKLSLVQELNGRRRMFLPSKMAVHQNVSNWLQVSHSEQIQPPSRYRGACEFPGVVLFGKICQTKTGIFLKSKEKFWFFESLLSSKKVVFSKSGFFTIFKNKQFSSNQDFLPSSGEGS